MIGLHELRTQTDGMIQGLQRRHLPDARARVHHLLELDSQRKAAQAKADDLAAQLNQFTKQVQLGKSEGVLTDDARARVVALKANHKHAVHALQQSEQALQEALADLPNVPHPDVPEGKEPRANEVIYISTQAFPETEEGLPHWELAETYGIVDFKTGVKLAGAGFPVYRGQGAQLQRALIHFFLDQACKAGYEEVQTPIVVNKAAAFGTGQLPDKDGMMYKLQDEDLYMVPTAEVPVTNLYRESLLDQTDLPIKHVAYTPCFRREAGSWGRRVRGLNRLHQFDKVELVQIQKPESALDALHDMCSYVQSLLEQLQLPYRVLKLCAGELGFAASLTYDIEVFSSAQKQWLEVSSLSTFGTYQARRMNLRYKDGHAWQWPHTLNGSALALPRVVAALLEDHQTSESIDIPPVLHPYTGFSKILRPNAHA